MKHFASGRVLIVNYSWIIALTASVSPVSRHNVKKMKSWQKQNSLLSNDHSRAHARTHHTENYISYDSHEKPANQSYDGLRQWRHTRPAFTHAKQFPAELQNEDEVAEFINAD